MTVTTPTWQMPHLPPGTVLPVLEAPHRVLSEPGAEVDPTDPRTVALAADLLATQDVSPGASAWPPSRSGSRRGCSASTSRATPRRARATAASSCATPRPSPPPAASAAGRGACRCPTSPATWSRARRLVVRGQLPVTGEWVEIVTDAFEAVALQHEIDHTQGLLFLDRVAGPHGIHPRRTYR